MSMTKAEEYFEKVAVDDVKHLISIGELACKDIYHYFRIKMNKPQIPIACYSLFFECILKHLKSLQKTKETHAIIIANRLEIGFTTSFETEENSDLEKFGNFSIYMKHIDNNRLTEVDESEPKSVVRCTQWNESNNTTSITDIKAITKLASEKMESELSIQGANPEIVLPIFCTVHDDIIAYAKLKRAEENDFELMIDVAGCYRLYVRQMEDGVEISYKPCVYSKGTIKEDGDATTKHE